MSPVVAAIDCGTNSTRLLVSDGERTLDRQMRITRLGEGVDATGVLAPTAIERTVEVLRGFRRSIDAHGATAVMATATSAARDAANRDELFDAAEAVLGARPVLLSGEEEASLSFAGATAELDPADGPFLVVDIGGGSTEIVVGSEAPVGSRSIDMGCVRVTERFLRRDPPAPEELAQAISLFRHHLDDLVRQVPEVLTARTMVGLAGTVTTVAAVELGLHTYDRDRIHHMRLTREAAEDVFRTLATEPREQRSKNPGLDPARVDVIVGGTLLLVTVLRYLDLPGCLVSESDILDGVVARLIAEQ